MDKAQRIEQLEMKVAFHEDNIEALNDEIFQQQRKIQLLSDQLAIVVAKLKDNQPNQLAAEKEEMPPPHY